MPVHMCRRMHSLPLGPSLFQATCFLTVALSCGTQLSAVGVPNPKSSMEPLSSMPETDMSKWHFAGVSSQYAAHDGRYGPRVYSVYGAGGAAAYYHGAEKTFDALSYDDPEPDRLDTRSQHAWARGMADHLGAKSSKNGDTVIVPTQPLTSTSHPDKVSDTEGRDSVHDRVYDNDPNSVRPVSSPWVESRRGSQMTRIGAGSGAPENQIREKPLRHWVFLQLQRWFQPTRQEPEYPGSGIGTDMSLPVPVSLRGTTSLNTAGPPQGKVQGAPSRIYPAYARSAPNPHNSVPHSIFPRRIIGSPRPGQGHLSDAQPAHFHPKGGAGSGLPADTQSKHGYGESDLV